MCYKGRRHRFSGILLLSITLFVCRTLAGGENTTGTNHGTDEDSHDDDSEDDSHSHVPERYPVAEIHWEHVETPYIISLWVLFASYAKIAFHLTDKLARIFPESCLLIILGIVVGVIIYFAANDVMSDYTLDSDTFFLFLLPPIVLEAGYFMPNRSFFDNIGTILLYAVVGTLFNCFCIGASLFGIVSLGWVSVPMDFLDCLVFSSLISAVDPVAVLAVFEEVHVNEVLYILVFGESLLNDAVTVVLYRMFKQFAAMGVENVQAVDCVLGVTSFLIIGCAGTIIGIIWGLLTAFVTKFTDHVRVIEPLFVFLMSYLSYLTAEIFGFSGIMSIVFCGIIMKKYVEANISQKSHTTIKYFMKMLSSISETIIFMFLGLSAVRDDHVWDVAFILSTLFFCLFYRAIGVIILTALANQFRAIKVNKVEQFIMAYGGLRGAIAFSLVALLDGPADRKSLFVTTCMIVIFFTVFIQGMTIKPLVDKLKVKRSNKHKPSMGEKIFTRMIDHAMAGIEDVIGSHGHNYWRDKWEEIDRKYVQPLLLRELPQAKDCQILQVYTNLNIKDAMEYVKTAGSFNIKHGSMANFLRRSTSQAGLQGRNGSIPYNVSDICLDMHSVGGAGEFARREVDDAEIHHVSNIVFDSMHQPKKKHRYKRMKHQMMDTELEKNDHLLHRSVHLHLRHVMKQRKKKAKMANRPSHHSLNSNKNSSHNHLEKHDKHDKHDKGHGHHKTPHKNVSFSLDTPLGEDDILSHVHIEPTLKEESDDEGGITFEARPSDKHPGTGDTSEHHPGITMHPDLLDNPSSPIVVHVLVGNGEFDEPDAPSSPRGKIEPTAAESLLPWKQYSEPCLSDRARQESFGALGTPTPTPPASEDEDEEGGKPITLKLDFSIGDGQDFLNVPDERLASPPGLGDEHFRHSPVHSPVLVRKRHRHRSDSSRHEFDPSPRQDSEESSDFQPDSGRGDEERDDHHRDKPHHHHHRHHHHHHHHHQRPDSSDSEGEDNPLYHGDDSHIIDIENNPIPPTDIPMTCRDQELNINLLSADTRNQDINYESSV
ncbi:sodium/hydrogen exchanger 3-like isoform X2 [Glandiceps talaboti]